MAIHYIGRLAPQSGKRACGAVSGQAESHDLHATDCMGCKAALLETVIVHTEPGSVPATIAEVQSGQVALSWFGQDRVWMPWHRLDIPNPWSKVEPDAPAPVGA